MDVNQKVQAHVAQSIGTLWLEVQRQMVLAETYEQEVKRLRAEKEDARPSQDAVVPEA